MGGAGRGCFLESVNKEGLCKVKQNSIKEKERLGGLLGIVTRSPKNTQGNQGPI